MGVELVKALLFTAFVTASTPPTDAGANLQYVMYNCRECTYRGKGLVITWNLPKPECEQGEISVYQNSKNLKDCGPFSASSIKVDGECYTSTLTVDSSSISAEKLQDIACKVHKWFSTDLKLDDSSGDFFEIELPFTLKVCPTYDSSTKALCAVKTIWPQWMYSAVDAYIVYIRADNIKSSIDVVNISSTVEDCNMESDCFYWTKLPMIDGAEEYHVKVVADTSYNHGTKVESSTLHIGVTNNLLSVEVMVDYPTVTATCSFLSGFTGSAHCRVDYGTSPDSLEYSAASESMSSAGGSVSAEFELDKHIFDLGSELHLQASVDDSECVHVTGSVQITKYCKTSHLQSGVKLHENGDESLCDGKMTLPIEGGYVCYTGTKPGSTAEYNCDEGYGLVGSDREYNCMIVGRWDWDEEAPYCARCDPDDLTSQNMGGNPSKSVCDKGDTPVFFNGGTVCYTGTTPGSTAVYHCAEGYELVGEKNTRECMTNGDWGGAAPTCDPKCTQSDLGGDPSVCAKGETPLFINGGTVCYDDTKTGSTATYYCDEGYGLVGESNRKCKSTGRWNGEKPKCIRCNVTDLGNNSNNNDKLAVCGEGEKPLLINESTVCYSGTSPGSTAVYHCDNGDQLRICQQSGKWNGTNPICSSGKKSYVNTFLVFICFFLEVLYLLCSNN